MTHTPAPWKIDSYGDIVDEKGRGIAFGKYLESETGIGVYNEYKPIEDANAALIASAPDLLMALGLLFKLLPDYPPHDPNRSIVDIARKAYHKARGNA